MNTKKILLATNNKGKIKEFQDIYAEIDNIQFITPKDLNLQIEVDETGKTYHENATLKAIAFAKASGLLCLADDSGLEVDALNGAPGIYSARFSPLPNAKDVDRRKHLISELKNSPQPWTARFKCSIVIATPDEVLGIFDGSCEGMILPEDRGENGFGYDPCFFVEEYQKTMAELSDQIKNQISHRARAAQKTFEFLKHLSD